MNLRYRLFLYSVCAMAIITTAHGQSPKREFRGAWIATVTNLDWPTSRSLSTQAQKDQLTAMLDGLYDAGINAVIFQVRPECDALYQSPYEPWSYWLTGSQGTPPSPLYDPLEFAVAEAHKRGMEIHAWFNPFRAYRQNNVYSAAPNHVTQQHPEWILTCPDGYKILDPGLPAARDHISLVMSDVIRRYDIDGIHMDDYFYPYPEHNFTVEDSASFRLYPRGFAPNQVDDWRRDNVNVLMQQVYDSIQALKPWVKLGMSPFGIYRSGTPPGISGMSSVDVIYCDALAWLRDGSVDYLTPQLYWGFGGGQDYGLLQGWWSDSTGFYGRHLYTGNATYRIQTHGWPTQEIANQIEANRQNPQVQGSIQFRAKYIETNYGGIRTRLKNEIFRYAAAPPVMAWKEMTPPGDPTLLSATEDPGTAAYRLSWTGPTAASDGDTAARYIVYRFNTASVQPGDQDNPTHLLAMAGEPTIVPQARLDTPGVQYSYAISALDRNNNESGLSNLTQISTPVSAPVLSSPPANEQHFGKTSTLSWEMPPNALGFRVQVSLDSAFGEGQFIVDKRLNDSSTTVSGLQAQTSYWWRVMAGNQGGTSDYSTGRMFTTGWPGPPTIISPNIALNEPLLPTFAWSGPGGTSFRIQVTDNVTYATVINTTVSDTTYTATTALLPVRIYTWKVQSINAYGSSDWSAEGRFRTTTGTSVEQTDEIPAEFALSQNFPNPFNPTTTIRFTLEETGHASLRVYNVLGQEISVLYNEDAGPGSYTVHFDAGAIPSGTYFYVLSSGGSRITKRMILLK